MYKLDILINIFVLIVLMLDATRLGFENFVANGFAYLIAVVYVIGEIIYWNIKGKKNK